MKPQSFVAPHFHCDPVWLGDQSTCIWRSIMNADEFVECCLQDEHYEAVLSEIDYLKPYTDYLLDRRQALKELIAEGRIETAGSYNEPNEVSLGLEALVRNLVMGKLWHEKQLGDKPTVYQPHDVFGHCRRLPQLLQSLGFRGMIYTKGNPPAFVEKYPFPRVFRYLAPDGSEMVLRREEYAALMHAETLEELHSMAAESLAEQVKQGIPYDVKMLGTDFRPPKPWLMGSTRLLARQDPPVKISVPSRYFEALEKAQAEHKVKLPLSTRDLAHYHIGTSVSRSGLKIGNRLGEIRVQEAELFATLAALEGAEYPYLALDKAWRQLLFVHHHDSITGTQADRPYLDLLASYRESLELSSEVLYNACTELAKQVDTRLPEPEAKTVVVFNPLQHTYAAPCELTLEGVFDDVDVFDPTGSPVPHQVLFRDMHGITIRFWAEDVPGIGYKTFYYLTKNPRTHEPRVDCENVIENEFFRLEVDPAKGGGIVSLVDKETGRELVDTTSAQPLNDIALLIEGPGQEPSWEFHTTGEKHFASDCEATVTRLIGPVAQKLVIETRLAGEHEIVREIALHKGKRRVDFETRFINYKGNCPPDNRGRGDNPRRDYFLALFPLDLPNTVPVYDDRNTLVARKRSLKTLDFDTSQWRMYSGCAVYSAGRFCALGSAVSLRCGKDEAAPALPLGLGALIAPEGEEYTKASEALILAFNPHGITLTAFSETDDFNADIFYQNFRIAFGTEGEGAYAKQLLADSPEAADYVKRTLEQADYAFCLVWDRQVPQGAPSDEAWNHGDVRSATVPFAFDPIPVLLVYARNSSALQRAVEALTVDLEDEVIELPPEADFIELQAPVPDYTAAVINNGNLGMSVEPGNLVTLSLFHVAAWSNRYFPKVFVDENGTRVFHYALYAAPGQVRDCGLLSEAEAFQHGFLPVLQGQHKGTKPKVGTLLSLEGDGGLLLSFKAAGYPAMTGERPENSTTFSAVLRLVEERGRTGRLRLGLPQAPTAAARCNLAEVPFEELEATETLDLELKPNALETFKFTFERSLPEVPQVLGRLVEDCQPVCVRYWELNQGAAPIGNMPVALAFWGPTATMHTNELKLGVANNYLDRAIKGTVRIKLPPGTESDKTEIPFELKPQEVLLETVPVFVSHSCPGGWLVAQLEHEGQLYQDYVEVHQAAPLQWQAWREAGGTAVKVRLYNPNRQPVSGQVALISLPETWGERHAPTYRVIMIDPWRQGYTLEPGEERTLSFTLEPLAGAGEAVLRSFWCALRLTWQDAVEYVVLD